MFTITDFAWVYPRKMGQQPTTGYEAIKLIENLSISTSPGMIRGEGCNAGP